jgi:hypothetical protein
MAPLDTTIVVIVGEKEEIKSTRKKGTDIKRILYIPFIQTCPRCASIYPNDLASSRYRIGVFDDEDP